MTTDPTRGDRFKLFTGTVQVLSLLSGADGKPVRVNCFWLGPNGGEDRERGTVTFRPDFLRKWGKRVEKGLTTDSGGGARYDSFIHWASTG